MAFISDLLGPSLHVVNGVTTRLKTGTPCIRRQLASTKIDGFGDYQRCQKYVANKSSWDEDRHAISNAQVLTTREFGKVQAASDESTIRA